MAQDDPEHSKAAFDDFAARLDEARGQANPSRTEQAARGAAMGLGIKLASELIAALIVGGAIGYGADLVFKKSPLFLLLGLALGLAAAFLSVLRMMKKLSDQSVAENSAVDKSTKPE